MSDFEGWQKQQHANLQSELESFSRGYDQGYRVAIEFIFELVQTTTKNELLQKIADEMERVMK